MLTFMDRHNAADVTYDDIAEAHRLDLATQEKYDVRFLGYWFDPDLGVGCCIAEAPTADAMVAVHSAAHGAVPAEIIEVDMEEVLAFMGRISHPSPDDLEAGTDRPDSPFRTIMFTDMMGSTPLTVHLGDTEAVDLLERHDVAIREAAASHGGRIVKHTGDGFLIAFDRVDDALHGAIRIQRGVSSLHELLSVKIGVNPGNPVERGGDLFGVTIQGTARICELAEGGQILVPGIVRELCEDPDLADRFVEHGREGIKGFHTAMYLYEVQWEDTQVGREG